MLTSWFSREALDGLADRDRARARRRRRPRRRRRRGALALRNAPLGLGELRGEEALAGRRREVPRAQAGTLGRGAAAAERRATAATGRRPRQSAGRTGSILAAGSRKRRYATRLRDRPCALSGRSASMPRPDAGLRATDERLCTQGNGEGERRVALVPEVGRAARRGGIEVTIEAGAGEAAHYPDADYEEAGASARRRLGRRGGGQGRAALGRGDRPARRAARC